MNNKSTFAVLVALTSAMVACGPNLALPAPVAIAAPVSDSAPATDATPTDDALEGECTPGESRGCTARCGSYGYTAGIQYCGTLGDWQTCLPTENCPEVPEDVSTPPTPSLIVNLASTPMRTETVKKAPNVPATGFVFTARPESNLMIQEVLLTGQGNVDGTYRPNALAEIVTSCALFSGVTQVGTFQSPDSSGRMRITRMHFLIEAGTSQTFTVRCTNDSVVQQLVAGDRYSVGIASASDVVAVNDSDVEVLVGISSGVLANASSNPVDFVTVYDRGGLTVEIDPTVMPASSIVLGSGVWNLAAGMVANAQLEANEISRLSLQLVGDSALIDGIAIASVNDDGLVHVQGAIPVGVNEMTDMDLSSAPIRVEPGRPTRFQVWVRARSNREVLGGTYPYISFRIASGVTTGEWDPGFSLDRLNIRATGVLSGDRLFARAPCESCSTRTSAAMLAR